jgi:hypothetical protein
MSKVELIERTIGNMQALPEQELAAVHDFAAFITLTEKYPYRRNNPGESFLLFVRERAK